MYPWVVGWIASDGHNSGAGWSVSQNIDDVDALMLIREMIPDTGLRLESKDETHYGNKQMVSIWRNNWEDSAKLVQWGVPVGNKTESLSFPTTFPDSDVWLYLRGVFEGDGSVSLDRGRYPRIGITCSPLWCSGCRQWLKERDIQSYVTKDGIVACLNIHNIRGFRDFTENIYKIDKHYRMGRKFSAVMKALCVADVRNIKARLSLQRNERKVLVALIKEKILCGATTPEILSELKAPAGLVRDISAKLSKRKAKSAKIVSACKLLILDGKSVADVVRLGYGVKLSQRAYREVFGTSSGAAREKNREEKTQKIRQMILGGCYVKQIVKDTRCAEAKVVKERKALASMGYPIKLNKRRDCEQDIDGIQRVQSENHGS